MNDEFTDKIHLSKFTFRNSLFKITFSKFTFQIYFFGAIVQYQRKHRKILATIFLLLPTVLNCRVSHYSGRSHYFFPHTKLLPS